MARRAYMNAQMLSLEFLIDGIGRGAIVVPDFQRSFVWSQEQVRSLLGTVFNGWPAGSILLMRGHTSEFRLRPLVEGPTGSHPELVVLDGQQRLTAMARALSGSGPDIFLISVPPDPELDQLDDYTLDEQVSWLKEGAFKASMPTPAAQWARRKIPVSSLISPSDFFLWRDEATEDLPVSEQIHDRRIITDFYKQWLSPVHGYSLPAVTLDTDLELAAIARIFERVNTTGLSLSAFDLMVARAYEPGWNLREEWESARLRYPYVDDFFANNGMPILQTISLRESGDVRQRAVLSLPPSTVRGEWAPTVRATEEALRFVARRCGVEEREWLPYAALILALAGAAREDLIERNRQRLEQWFWSRSFSQAFDVAANTRVVSEYQSLRTWLHGGRPVEMVTVSRASLLEATRRSARALWGAFLSLLSLRSDADILGDARGTLPTSQEQPTFITSSERKQIVSIYSSQSADSDSPHLRVLGLVLASRDTARRIRRGGFLYAVQEAVERRGVAVVDAALDAQLLPPSHELLELGAPSDLLLYRAQRIEAFLSESPLVRVEKEG